MVNGKIRVELRTLLYQLGNCVDRHRTVTTGFEKGFESLLGSLLAMKQASEKSPRS